MKPVSLVIVSTAVAIASAAPAVAQTSQALAAQARDRRDARYQIGMMEGVLEKAVEHGAAVMRERLQKVLPADLLLSQPVRVRGVRLDGYGVVFDIDVPSLQSTPLWSLQTLDQNNLGLESAMNALRAHVEATGDASLKQALERMELAVPLAPAVNPPAAAGASARPVSGSALSTNDDAVAASPVGSAAWFAEQRAAYRSEITDALMEAMLDHSRGLDIGPTDWLTIVAGGVDNQPLTGLDSDVPEPAVISIKGSDLADFLANRISHDEARQRMQVKLF